MNRSNNEKDALIAFVIASVISIAIGVILILI
jgi:hypothetical protein